MYYWNKDYFEGLQRLGAEVASSWPAYSDFALFRERGLRRAALTALSRFIGEMKIEELASRWAFVRFIYTQRHVDPTRVTPQPLRAQLMAPTLNQVVSAPDAPAEASLWMAHYFPEEVGRLFPIDPDAKATFLRKSIQRYPGDERLRHELAAHLLDGVEFDQHHLDESRYIGDAGYDQQQLLEAREILGLQSGSDLLKEIERAEALLSAWVRFSATRDGDFPAWCKRNGVEQPGRVIRVYYEK